MRLAHIRRQEDALARDFSIPAIADICSKTNGKLMSRSFPTTWYSTHQVELVIVRGITIERTLPLSYR